MASNSSPTATAAAGARGQAPSPRGILKRSWSSNSSTCTQGGSHHQMCVCAPATHAGSFKCRLHRTSSHNQSAASQPASAASASAGATTTTRSVEAQ